MTYLTAEDADDSYDEQKKVVLAKQMYGDRYMLWVDTISGKTQIGRVDGTYIADVHFALVDSTWYMWLSVDPLADKYPGNTPYMYCNGNIDRLNNLANGFSAYSRAGANGIAKKYTTFSKNQQYRILNFWRR